MRVVCHQERAPAGRRFSGLFHDATSYSSHKVICPTSKTWLNVYCENMFNMLITVFGYVLRYHTYAYFYFRATTRIKHYNIAIVRFTAVRKWKAGIRLEQHPLMLLTHTIKICKKDCNYCVTGLNIYCLIICTTVIFNKHNLYVTNIRY